MNQTDKKGPPEAIGPLPGGGSGQRPGGPARRGDGHISLSLSFSLSLSLEHRWLSGRSRSCLRVDLGSIPASAIHSVDCESASLPKFAGESQT